MKTLCRCVWFYCEVNYWVEWISQNTQKKKPVISPYIFHDTTLRTTENAKYIGVTFNSNLNWSSHINTITHKAKISLRFISQNVKTQNKQPIEVSYRTYVHRQVEYCLTIWHPRQKTTQIEQKWFKGKPQGMFKMTINTQSVLQTCA